MSKACSECGADLEGELEACPRCGHVFKGSQDDFGAFFKERPEPAEEDERFSLQALAAAPVHTGPPRRKRPSHQESRLLEAEHWREGAPASVSLAELVSTGSGPSHLPAPMPSKYPAYVTAETDHSVRSLLYEAEEAVLDKDFERAYARFEAALELRMDQVDVLLRLAEIAGKRGDTQRRSRCYVSLFQLATEPAERADYLVKAAMAYPREGKALSEKSLKALTMALSIDPGSEAAFDALCTHHEKHGDAHQVALLHQERIRHLSAHPPSDGKVVVALWKAFAKALERAGQHDNAKVAQETFKRLKKERKKRK